MIQIAPAPPEPRIEPCPQACRCICAQMLMTDEWSVYACPTYTQTPIYMHWSCALSRNVITPDWLRNTIITECLRAEIEDFKRNPTHENT